MPTEEVSKGCVTLSTWTSFYDILSEYYRTLGCRIAGHKYFGTYLREVTVTAVCHWENTDWMSLGDKNLDDIQ
jgi:hypothetical protein